MPRRTSPLPAPAARSFLVALGAVAALCTVLGAGAGADAADQQGATSRVGSNARSVALFGDGADVQVATGVMGTRPHKSAVLALPNVPFATAVNPVGGKGGLLCDGSDHIYPVTGLRTTPGMSGNSIDGSAYGGEGGATYRFLCYGVAMRGSVALATGDSQGLLQVVRRNGGWRADARVQFPGVNDAGQPHVPGWIPFPDSSSVATVFNSVAIAPRPMANGRRLAVAIDREDHTVVVVGGVGTATPHVLGSLSAAGLDNTVADQGTGGLAFLPSSPDRAVLTTTTGFAVLNRHKPSEPRLRVRTTVGDGSGPPSAITVSSDSDHLAVAAGGRIYGYRNVLGAVRHGRPFRKQTSFEINASETVGDLAYTGNDTLVVLHGDPVTAADWFLTLVDKVPLGHHAVRGSISTTKPSWASGTLSVWPGP